MGMFIIISTLSYSVLADKLKDLSPQQIESKMKELLIIGKTDENEKILREYIEFLEEYSCNNKQFEQDIYTARLESEKEFKKYYPKCYENFKYLEYRFQKQDGEFIDVVINYNKLIKNYKKYISKTYCDYLDYMTRERVVSESCMMQSYDYVFEYIVKGDTFLDESNNKYKKEKEEVQDTQKLLTLIYFLGPWDEPIFEIGKNKIEDKEIIEGFKRNIKKYGDTKTGKLLKEYYELLKKNRFYKTKEVKEFLSRNKIGFEFE